MEHLSPAEYTRFSEGGVKLPAATLKAIADGLAKKATDIMARRDEGDPNRMVLFTQCIEAAVAVMGEKRGNGNGLSASYTDEKGAARSTTPAYSTDSSLFQGMADKIYNSLRAAILAKGGEPTGTEGRDFYNAQPDPEKQRMDKESGINTGANPAVGEAYTVLPDPTASKCCYHWAGVVAKDGGDNVTIENARWVGTDMDRGWFFGMYGTQESEQSFHTYQSKTRTDYNYGDKSTRLTIKRDTGLVPSPAAAVQPHPAEDGSPAAESSVIRAAAGVGLDAPRAEYPAPRSHPEQLWA